MNENTPAAPVMTPVEEQSRIYHYPDGGTFRMDNVVGFAAPRTTHRLETADGRKWVVAPGWRVIEINVSTWSR